VTSPAALGRYTRVAAYVRCQDGDGRVLLCRLAAENPEIGAWTLPGGGLEFGEDPATGALRELEEECGLRGEIDGLLGVDARHYPPEATRSGREVHAVRIVYRGRIVGGDLRDEIGGSSDRCAWFTRDEANGLPLLDLVPYALAL
jgi:ADP-ribose pyrophosphatase YjhB (NUDIX family)